MKKTLKVIASAAVAMSAFASVAMADDAATTSSTTTTDSSATATTTATKTSADFKDLANVDAALKAKIDALLKAGVFEGVSDDSFGIDENMTRAQFAKVLDLIYGVNVDMSVKSSSFSDVKADDQANGWAIPYIEAAKKAGLIDGVSDTTFVPGDNVTLGQFATALVKGLGVKPDMTGTPWYADAVKQAVAKNVLPADTDGSKLATRADLVVGAYGGQQAYNEANKPAQVSVASVKATGVKTVQVTLDRDVDTSKATLDLKTAGSVSIATTTKWSDDKKTATLTLTDTVLRAGDYTVTLGGLDAADIKTATGTFTAQDEQVQKIEFVTASDTIAKANSVVVKIKATNQYGELASASAGNYNTYGAFKLTKDIDGYLLASVDTHDATSGVGIVTVTIINNDSHVTATKNFTVGTEPILSKMELGSAQYTNGTSLSGSGDNVKFALNMYDQYGSMMGYDALNIGGSNELKPTVIWNDYLEGATYTTEDDGNNNPILKISVGTGIDKTGDFNFTVIDQAASATGKISIQSAKVATKVQIGSYDDVIAAGDKNVYIPVIAYDAAGNQLTPDELVNDDNYDRITVSSAYSSSNKLEKSGNHKGTIHLKNLPATKNGAISVSVFIATANVSSTDTKTYTVQGARIPDHFKEVTAPASQVTAGGYTAFKYAVIDQYGKELDDLQPVDSQGNVTSGGQNYRVTVQANTYSAADVLQTGVAVGSAFNPSVLTNVYGAVVSDNDNGVNAIVFADSTPTVLPTDLHNNLNSKTKRFTSAPGAEGSKTDFILRIEKLGTDNTTWNQISKFTKTVTVAKANDDLTYALNSVPALWNAIDSDAISETNTVNNFNGQTASVGGWFYNNGPTDYNTYNDLVDPTKSRFAREVTVSGTNKAGEKVGVAKQILAITSSDPSVAKVALNGTKAYVLGNKAGTANISVSFKTAKGETKSLSTTVTVKSDALNVSKITWDDNAYYDGLNFNAFNKLNVTDSYGVGYEDAVTNATDMGSGRAQRYNYLLGVTFSVSNVLGTSGVSIDGYGNVTVNTPDGSLKDDTNADIATFDLTATSPTGKSATVSISSKAGVTTRTVWK